MTLTLGVNLTSCLGDDDTPDTVGTYMDVATVSGYSDATVYFSVVAPVSGKLLSLYSSNISAIDKTKYPVESRVLITYVADASQNMDLPVKIDLMSVRPVTVVPLENATSNECVMTYPAFNVSNCYVAGNYINAIIYLNKAQKRVWKCLLNTSDSDGDTANIYLIPESTGTDYIGTTEVVSIEISTLMSKYKKINLHVNNQTGNNSVIALDLTGGKN